MKKLEKRINKEDFFKYLDLLRRNDKVIKSTYDLFEGSLDIINLNEYLTEPYNIILKNFFSDNELDYISWYLWEDVEKKIYDGKTHEVIAILDNDEALWKFLNE